MAAVVSPLAGITVLEVASFIAGPYAGMLLADLGAQVIKVETPDGGDPFRGFDTGRESPGFWAYNRGKRSITLNLREPAAIEVMGHLIRDADVLLENMRPGAMDRLGLGYAHANAINPRLVYASVTGFGASGPYRDRPAYDGIGQALSGLLSLLSDRTAIQPIGPNFSDSLAGLFAAYGILAALVARSQTGAGQHVQTSLVAATLAFLVAPATDTLNGAPAPGPLSRPTSSQTYAWLASDGLPLTVHLSSPPKFWEGLARATVGRTCSRTRVSVLASRGASTMRSCAMNWAAFSARVRGTSGSSALPRTMCPAHRCTTCSRCSLIRKSSTLVCARLSSGRQIRPSTRSAVR